MLVLRRRPREGVSFARFSGVTSSAEAAAAPVLDLPPTRFSGVAFSAIDTAAAAASAAVAAALLEGVALLRLGVRRPLGVVGGSAAGRVGVAGADTDFRLREGVASFLDFFVGVVSESGIVASLFPFDEGEGGLARRLVGVPSASSTFLATFGLSKTSSMIWSTSAMSPNFMWATMSGTAEEEDFESTLTLRRAAILCALGEAEAEASRLSSTR